MARTETGISIRIGTSTQTRYKIEIALGLGLLLVLVLTLELRLEHIIRTKTRLDYWLLVRLWMVPWLSHKMGFGLGIGLGLSILLWMGMGLTLIPVDCLTVVGNILTNLLFTSIFKSLINKLKQYKINTPILG